MTHHLLPPRGHHHRGLLLCLVFLCLVAPRVPPALAVPLKPGPDTTVITGPRRDDGTLDYVAAMNQRMAKGVTPKNNAFVVIADLMPAERWPTAAHRRAVYEKLGTPMPRDNAAAFITIGAFAKQRDADPSKAADRTYRADDGVWSADDLPLIDAWLNRNRAALARLREAVRRPGYFSPLVGDQGVPRTVGHAYLPELSFYRTLGRALTARINRARGREDMDAAVADALLLLRFSRLPGRHPLPISVLVGVSLSAAGRVAVVGLLNDPHLRPADLGRLIEGLRGLPPLPPVSPAFRQGQRFVVLDDVQRLPKGRFKSLLFELLGSESRDFYKPILQRLKPFLTSPAYDVNQTLRRVNRQFDAMPLGDQMPTYPGYVAANGLYGWWVTKVIAPRFTRAYSHQLDHHASASPSPRMRARLSRFVGDLVVRIMLEPAPYVKTDQQARMFEKLLLAAARLKKYQLEHGRYPDKPIEPITDFNGLPVVYRVEPHRVLLYSIGTDLTDDGGLFTSTGANSTIKDLPIAWSR